MKPSDLYKAGELASGVYTVSENFRKLDEMSCVYRKETAELIAVTGPAHDVESQMASDLFAAAPTMRDTIDVLLTIIQAADITDPLARRACANAQDLITQLGVAEVASNRAKAIDAQPATHLMKLLEQAYNAGYNCAVADGIAGAQLCLEHGMSGVRNSD